MRNPALLASLTLMALAFAGCAGDDGGGDVASTSTSASGTSTSTATGSSTSRPSTSGSASSSSTGSGPQNGPPTGTVSAEVNGTVVAFSLAGTDPDGDALSWTLAYGDGSADEAGTELPANVTHTYAVGNHTANFTITDGKDAKSYPLAVSITAGGSGPLTVVFTGSVTVPDPLAPADDSCAFALVDDSFGGVHDLPSQVLPSWTFLGTPDTVRATFSSADGNTIGGSGNSGTVGEGVSQAIVCATAPMVDYTLTLTEA